MKKTIKKRGQRFLKNFSHATTKASEESKEHIKENLIHRVSHVENIRLLVLEWVLLAVTLILLAVTQSVWFEESYTEETFADGGNYTEATLGSVNSLNPLFAITNSEKTLSRLMFSTISTIDYSGHPKVGLASYITPSESGRIWTMKLRDGLKWSDGQPITNEDVLFTLELIKNPLVGTIYDTNLANVKFAENENGEIVFTLPSTYADFISALNIPVVPKHELEDTDPKTLLEDTFSNSPVTSGAFSYNALQSVPSSNEKVYYLSPNQHYYKGRELLNGFAVHVYESKDAIISALNSGAVTATAELSGVDAEKITSGQIQQKDSSLNSGAFVFLNTSSPALKNVELRKAIREGIDLSSIRGEAPNATSLDYPLLASQISLADLPPIPERNVDSAKTKIMENTGEDSSIINVATVSSGYLPNVTNKLSEELNNLGLDTNVSIYEENQDFVNNVIAGRNYDILVYEVEMGADPDPLAYYHSSQNSNSGLNLSNYRNSLVDDLLLGARGTLDDALRAKKYETFLEYWMADAPAIGLYQSNLTYYYNRNIRTYSNNIRLVTPLDRFTDVAEWATVRSRKNKTP